MSGQRRFACSWDGKQEKGKGGSRTPETSRFKEWGQQGQVEVSNGKCQGGGELSSDRAVSPVARLTPAECVCIWQRLGLKITGSLVKERMGGHGEAISGRMLPGHFFLKQMFESVFPLSSQPSLLILLSFSTAPGWLHAPPPFSSTLIRSVQGCKPSLRFYVEGKELVWLWRRKRDASINTRDMNIHSKQKRHVRSQTVRRRHQRDGSST